MKANRSLGLLERAVRETSFSSFQLLCSDCEIHTPRPSLKGGSKRVAAARPAISWAQRRRVHPGTRAHGPGAGYSRVSHPAGLAAALLPLHFTAFVGLSLARVSGRVRCGGPLSPRLVRSSKGWVHS